MLGTVQRGARRKHSILDSIEECAMQAEAKVSPRGSRTEGLDGLEAIFLAAAVLWACAMMLGL